MWADVDRAAVVGSVEPTVAEQHEAVDVSRLQEAATDLAVAVGGRDGPEPTRYGDWEKNGRCIDF